MKILFIISSSIAAIKCKDVLRLLKNNKIHVDCIVTENAKKIFNYKIIKNIILGELYTDQSEKNNKMLHIELSRKANIIIVCPATANTIAKYSNGLGDNLASSTLLASNKQIIFVPAMNVQMWNNKINQKNIKSLKDKGLEFIGPRFGKLYCGERGLGRIENSKIIYQIILKKLNKTNILKGKKCLVTAGPTVEQIDSVRYVSNFSSGKQGYEIANELALSGGNVTLISGPTNLQTPYKVKLIKINTSKEMFNAVKKVKKIDIGIFAAAVSDFVPKQIKNYKIKKNKIKKINLRPNIDILKYIGNQKKNRPKFLVGFAAETGIIKNARKKLIEKNCDLIIYNNINKIKNVFGSSYNTISIISSNDIVNYKKMSKTNCAKKIINTINNLYIKHL